MPKHTPEQVLNILDRETQKMTITAQQHGLAFFACAMFHDHQAQETATAKSINMAPNEWAAMIAEMVEAYPELREATLVGLALAGAEVQL